ncbi:MAG: lamin tail domain-containing protein [Candidatus Pacebacteria bacterium]|nr:lamin tail domain-containing protein [Candidatus Paceibacterota bacterium]
MSTVIHSACIGLIVFCPVAAYAAVLINEVAWMGTDASANDEWIELFNSGSDTVALDGWMLADSVGLEIPLMGSIGSGEYAVLERTDDSSAPGTAFLIYTGGLGNDGRTLSLVRGDGSLEDQVAGGSNWEQIGGDNTSKETAQRTNAGWVTAPATPGYANSDGVATEDAMAAHTEEAEIPLDAASDSETTAPETDTEQRSNTGKGITLTLPDIALSLDLYGPSVAFVGQPVSFSVQGSGLGKTWIDSLVYQWNFGDMHTATGANVQHTFMHPGTYVVVASGAFSRHKAAVRHELTVLPMSFSITRAANGDIQIHNDAVYEVDVSGMSVLGDVRMSFPEHTIMLPHATITIPKERLEQDVRKMIAVYDRTGAMVASVMPYARAPHDFVVAEAPETEVVYQNAVVQETGVVPRAQVVGHAVSVPPVHEVAAPTVQDVAVVPTKTADAQHTASVQQAHVPLKNERLPYLGLIAVLVLGILAVYARPPNK